mmetsp:Transcript_88992/g.229590  ORF Transcript_88992/g.229590 Transcript_88992/m.229590 type:complete len:130 (-) Transcript_88992:227-616(-)
MARLVSTVLATLFVLGAQLSIAAGEIGVVESEQANAETVGLNSVYKVTPEDAKAKAFLAKDPEVSVIEAEGSAAAEGADHEAGLVEDGGAPARTLVGCYGVGQSCFIDALCCSSRCITGTHRCGPAIRR